MGSGDEAWTDDLMLFSYDGGLLDDSGFRRVDVGDDRYYVSGVFFLRGHWAGPDSLAAFGEAYRASGVLPVDRAFGAFCCLIVRRDGEALFFTDNSNLHTLYVGRRAISDRFLDLARHEGTTSFDDDALCEFLALGSVYLGKTLIDGIATSASDRVYVVSDGVLRTEAKGVGDVDRRSTIEDVPSFFADVAYALDGERVTLSLTGGYDSRLIFACLNDHLAVDPFISCTDRRNPDVYWAVRAAAAGGKALDVLEIPKPAVTERYLRELVDDTDGVNCAVGDDAMRIRAFLRDRRERGYTCLLTGDGGVRHKDWHWLQDLPFYRRKHTNVGRFFDQRIEMIRSSVPFGERLAGRYQGLRPRLIQAMRRHLRPLNTQSYDAIGFHIQGDAVKAKYSAQSRLVPAYAPLWELELVRYSYRLPRRKRFFYNSIREITTRQSKAIARVRTVYGTTASSEPSYLLRDVAFQALDYARKAARLLGRRILHRHLFVGHATTWSTEADVRALDVSRRAVDFAVRERIIAPSAEVGTLSFGVLGRLIQLYLIDETLRAWRAGPADGDAAVRAQPPMISATSSR
jgi:hypothetical protein